MQNIGGKGGRQNHGREKKNGAKTRNRGEEREREKNKNGAEGEAPLGISNEDNGGRASLGKASNMVRNVE